MNIALFLTNAARQFSDRPAVSVGDEPHCTYGEMARRVATIAGNLRSSPRIEPGARVALAMTNCPEYLEVLFAVWYAGLCAVPMNARLHGRELADMIENAEARLCFATPDVAEEFSRHLGERGTRLYVIGEADYASLYLGEVVPMAETDSDAPAWIFYTSGTTGRPKGAVLTHRNLSVMAVAYLADIDSLGPHDCLIHVAAQSHASGLFALSHILKASHQIVPVNGGFDEDELANLVNRYRNVTFFVPPTLLRRLVEHDGFRAASHENIRTILCGAAPVFAEDLRRAAAAFGPVMWNGYGQGESPCTITAMSKAMIADAIETGDDRALASVGVARTGVDVRVCDQDGRRLPAGEVGEIFVRGDVVMKNYWNNDGATREALTPFGLRTGDIGMMDERGYLTLLDRAKDMIISGGINIYPREVEQALASHPSVAEVAVVGRADPEWGERVEAFVVLNQGVREDEAALDAHCLAQIARFKRPRAYRWVKTLPKNAHGKVLKGELRAILEAPGGR